MGKSARSIMESTVGRDTRVRHCRPCHPSFCREPRMKSRHLNAFVLIAAGLLSSGCATGPGRTAGDPLEPMNRAIYSFNNELDQYVAKPTATAYQKVTPSPVRTPVRNF